MKKIVSLLLVLLFITVLTVPAFADIIWDPPEEIEPAGAVSPIVTVVIVIAVVTAILIVGFGRRRGGRKE